MGTQKNVSMHRDGSIEHTKRMSNMVGKKISTILCSRFFQKMLEGGRRGGGGGIIMR